MLANTMCQRLFCLVPALPFENLVLRWPLISLARVSHPRVSHPHASKQKHKKHPKTSFCPPRPVTSRPAPPKQQIHRTNSVQKNSETAEFNKVRACRSKADSTLRSSQAVPHPSTNRALCRLTSEVRRDPVHSTWYGRRQQAESHIGTWNAKWQVVLAMICFAGDTHHNCCR